MLCKVILLKCNRWKGDTNYRVGIKLEFPDVDLLSIYNRLDKFTITSLSPRQLLNTFTGNKTSSLFIITEFSTKKYIPKSKIISNIKSGIYDISPNFKINDEKSRIIFNKFLDIKLPIDKIRLNPSFTLDTVQITPYIALRLILFYLYDEFYKTEYSRNN